MIMSPDHSFSFALAETLVDAKSIVHWSQSIRCQQCPGQLNLRQLFMTQAPIPHRSDLLQSFHSLFIHFFVSFKVHKRWWRLIVNRKPNIFSHRVCEVFLEISAKRVQAIPLIDRAVCYLINLVVRMIKNFLQLLNLCFSVFVVGILRNDLIVGFIDDILLLLL